MLLCNRWIRIGPGLDSKGDEQSIHSECDGGYTEVMDAGGVLDGNSSEHTDAEHYMEAVI